MDYKIASAWLQAVLVRTKKTQQAEQTVASAEVGPATVEWFQRLLDGIDEMEGG